MNIKSFSYLILANTTELFLQETLLLTGAALQDLLYEDNFYANRAVFYEGDDKIVILPSPLDPVLVEKYTQQLGYQNVIYWYPCVYTDNSLCKSVLKDSNLLQQVADCILLNPNIIVTSYAFSPDFEHFISVLKQFGLQFQLDNVPQYSDLTRKLNSKATFRRVVEAMEAETGVQWIPQGKILDWKAAESEIQTYIEAKKGFVAKASYGAAGRGLFLSPPVPTENTRAEFLESISKDPIWYAAPIVVETQIVAKSRHSPSIELKISDNNITITYLCNQILNEKGAFLGILLGKNIVLPEIEVQMRHIAKGIAKAYQSMGYRGFFDIDFVIDESQKAFAVETNARRTGGTHVYDLLRHRYGADWETQIYAASNDSWQMNQRFKTSRDVLEHFKDQLYDGEEGLIITHFSAELDVFGFVLIAKTSENLQIRWNPLKG